MSITRWIAELPSRMRREGVGETVRQASTEASRHLLKKTERYDWRGESIYGQEWDVLIILDGCRVDALEAVSEEYDFLPSEVGTFRSLGSTSQTWMERNFTDEHASEMATTAHVTGNPFSRDYLRREDFLLLDEVWEYGWDDGHGTVPARNVTDRAIAAARRHDSERLLAHYMQPHFPSVPDPLDSSMDIETFGEEWNSVWDRLRKNRIDEETVWESYLENLRYVLDDVVLLLENVDADTAVISADHGNAFGELGSYGHPKGLPISALRQVPWVETTAVDTNSYNPQIESSQTRTDEQEVESRLRNLGYL